MGKYYGFNPGDQFGRLTVIGKVNDSVNVNDGKHRTRYLCKCSCPNQTTVVVKGKDLVSGDVKSCGCLREDTCRDMNNIPEYTPASVTPRVLVGYYNMMYQSKINDPKVYISRKIKVYKPWTDYDNGPKAFYDDMANTYRNGYEVGMLDYTKGFIPGNVVWIDPKDDRNNELIEFNGNKYTVSEWNMALGLNDRTIRNRLDQDWPVENIISGIDPDDGYPTGMSNAIYFVNDYNRPLNKQEDYYYDENE